MATTTLGPTAVSHSGVRLLGRQRGGEDILALCVLLLATLLGLMTGYARGSGIDIGVDGLMVRPHLQGFHAPELLQGSQTPSYRWTTDRSMIVAPGLGRGLWQVDLRLGSPQPVGQPKEALITAGSQSWRVQLGAQQRVVSLLAPSGGGIRLAIEAPSARYGSDPRPLGITFFGAAFQPIAISVLPPVPVLLHSLLALLLAFITLRLIGLRAWQALLLSCIGLLLLVEGTATRPGAIGLYSIRLVAVTLLGLLLLTAARWAIPRLFRLRGIEIGAGALTALLLVVYVGYVLKAAGLLWPYFLAVDIEWHMEKTRRVFAGRIAELWLADSSFHQSVMPELWGENKPVIPYSPFYHIFSAIWAIFPWPLETSANMFSAVIDSMRPVMIFFLVRVFGFRDRAGVLAALVYSIIPATFLMHAWGNTPTTNGMWWSLLSITLLAATWDRLRNNRGAWLALTLVLMLTMLFYAVTAVFTTLLVLSVVMSLALTRRRGMAWPILLSLVVAILLSIGIYYWQFVGPIIERTIPKFTGAIQEGGKELGVVPISWPAYLWKYVYLLDIYGMYLPLGLGIAGWWVGVRKLSIRSMFGLLMTIWMIIAIIFWFVGFRVDMVDKQLFWLMPWMGIGAGIAIDRLLDNRAVSRWAVPLLVVGLLYVGSGAIYLWVHRLRSLPRSEGFTSLYQLLLKIL